MPHSVSNVPEIGLWKSIHKPLSDNASVCTSVNSMFFPSTKFDHKAEARGGATNEQAELMAQYEDERDDREEELNELYS